MMRRQSRQRSFSRRSSFGASESIRRKEPLKFDDVFDIQADIQKPGIVDSSFFEFFNEHAAVITSKFLKEIFGLLEHNNNL